MSDERERELYRAACNGDKEALERWEFLTGKDFVSPKAEKGLKAWRPCSHYMEMLVAEPPRTFSMLSLGSEFNLSLWTCATCRVIHGRWWAEVLRTRGTFHIAEPPNMDFSSWESGAIMEFGVHDYTTLGPSGGREVIEETFKVDLYSALDSDFEAVLYAVKHALLAIFMDAAEKILREVGPRTTQRRWNGPL